MKSLNEEWLAYRKACYGDALLTPIQHRETRQAFFSGCLAAFTHIAEAAELPPEQFNETFSAATKELNDALKPDDVTPPKSQR